MESFDFKAVKATVCNAGKFCEATGNMCGKNYRFMYAVCVFAFVCESGKEGERERETDGKRKGGAVLMIIWEGVCVTEFAPT